MSRNCTHLVIAATLASLTGISGAVAFENWPPSVVGTWNVTANQSQFTITISSMGAVGKCPMITGTITGTQTLSGSYCPGSGRIVFSRVPTTGPITQVYSASLSEVGNTLYMGGLFEQTDAGEYSFFAILPPPIQ